MVSCLRDQTWLCVYCWCQTPKSVVSPRRVITRAQSDRPARRDNTLIMFDPDYNIDATIFSHSHDILLIKSNSKFESRAIAVYVAMSPRYLVASIAVASIPVQENAHASFCRRLSVWNRTAPDQRHLLPVATTKLIMQCV